MKTATKFWTVRLAIVIANGPVLGYLQYRFPPTDPLLSYLCWMSWATWLSAELPSGDTG